MKTLRKADKNIVGRGRHQPSTETSRAVKDLRSRLAHKTNDQAYSAEFLNTFAHNQQSALPISLILVLATAATLVFGQALDLVEAAIWISLQLASYSLMLRRSRMHIRAVERDELTSNAETRTRRMFIFYSFLGGLGWALLVAFLWWKQPNVPYEPLMFGLLLVFATKCAQIGSAIPAAPFAAAVLPVMAGSAILLTKPTVFNITMAIILPCAQLFVSAIAIRLQESDIRDIALKSEKDAMIADLETARIMSETARSQAEEANLAKSRFLAAMSHELRTPLNAILGFSEVMGNELLGPIENEHYKEYAQDIHASGAHLLSLINEILDLSRIEAGRYELREEPLYLHEVSHDAMNMIELRAASKEIKLHARIQENLPKILADQKAVRQIMLNLLSNAVKFTPKGGDVTLKVGWTASGGQYFSITDTGPGIPEEEIAIVLSPFGQGSIAIDSAEQGTGLGLPIVRAMVDLHQGKFELQSKLRVGTSVTVKLPAKRVLESMPAYEQPITPDRADAKQDRLKNVGMAPKIQTPVPEKANSSSSNDQNEKMLRRMNKLLSEKK
jgi:two-component system cell cycle sensor histidine kinase PleC